MLPNRKRKSSGGWEPASPIILAAWHEPAWQKTLRIKEHINYAAEHGVLDNVDKFLHNLKSDQWAYDDGITEWKDSKAKNQTIK